MVGSSPVRRLVPTWALVELMVRDGVTPEQAREAIYHCSSQGRITNYGESSRDKALWDLAEVRDVLPFSLPTRPGTSNT